MAAHVFRCIIALSAVVLLACDKTGPSPTPVQVQVRGTAPAAGAQSSFAAVAIGADGRETVVTNQATWQSSNTAVATVTGGVVQGVSGGSAEISATYGGLTGRMAVDISVIPCTFDIQPTQVNLPGAGGSATIAINMTQGVSCSWAAQSTGYLAFIGPNSGVGTGTVTVAAGFNPSALRIATMNVAGATVTVTQARGECVTSVSPATQSVAEDGGSFLLSVAAPTGCQWTVSSDKAFVTADQRVFTGTLSMNYQVEPNPSTNMRQATLTIDKFTIVVTQSGPVQQRFR